MGHLDHYDRAQVQQLLALDPLIGSYNVDFMTNLGTVVTYPRNHQSAAFTTDSLGFRVGDNDGRAIRVDELGLQDAGYGLVLGSSSAFGYGSSSDSQTLASHLFAITGRPYYNLGVPGANSHQLLSVAAEYAARAEHIVIFSGWVSLVAELKTQRPHTPHGASIYERLVGRIENEPIFSLVAKLTGRMPATPPAAGTAPPDEPNMSRADLDRRVQHAVSIQVLDAEILQRIAPPQAEVTYVLQPLASSTRRQLVEEEQPLFDLELPILGDTRALLFSEWDSYAEKLRSAFHAAGLPFLDIPANSLEGWSFHDMTHLTDGGYAQVAAQVARLTARVSA